MDLQYCHNDYCTGTKLTSTSPIDEDQECFICYMPLKGHEIGMMRECMHILCAECMSNWNNDDCAYCRVTSYMSIYSHSVFKGEEKKTLFHQHRNCELNDPAFRRFMDKIDSEEWLTFINLMLNSEERLPVDYDVHDFCATTGLTLLSYGEKLIIFYLGNEEFYRFIIYLRLPGNVDFQIMFSNENIEYNEADYDYADRFVGCLNQQWKHSSKAFPNALNDTDNNNFNFLMGRKFGDINCILGIDLRNPQPNFDPNDPDAIMKNKISKSYRTNFLGLGDINLSVAYRHLFVSEYSVEGGDILT